MKKVTTFLAAACISAGLALAQGPGPGGPRGTPPDPQTMIQNRVDHLATLLNLTDSQKTQATTIFMNALTASQALETNLRTSRQSLAAAVKQNAPAAIDQAASAIGTATGQLLAINSKADAAFYAILTPDQQAKFDAMPHFGMGGPGGPMMHGGFGSSHMHSRNQ